MKKLMSYLFSFAVVPSLFAQLNTFYMNEVTASSQWHYNPALQSPEKINVYLPFISTLHLEAINTAFSYNDAIQNNEIQITSIINKLEDNNHLMERFHVQLLGLGYTGGSMQFRAGLTAHWDSRITYSKDLIELIWKGNGHPDLIGSRLSMDGTAANSMAWLTYYIGASRRLMNDRLSLGINLKYYRGIALSYTAQSEFGLYTNEDNYHLTADGKFNHYISGNEVFSDPLNAGLFSPFNAASNTGAGIDIGISFALNDKLILQSSAINVGSIRWSEDIENYRLTNQEVTYQGISLNEFFMSPDSTTSTLEQFADSLTELFTPEEGAQDLNLAMNSTFYLGARYALSSRQELTIFVGDQQNFGTHFFSAGGLYIRQIGDWISLNGGFQLFNMQEPLVPLGFLIHVGPVQFGVHTDNALAILSPRNIRYAAGTFSVALRFNRSTLSQEINESQN